MSKKAIAAPTTYYVYTYAFPDGTVFYVGKGCNARIDEHEREACSDCACQKCCIIRQIWKEGHPVRKRIVYETFKEHEALAQEHLLIQTYGLENLTNVKKGTSYRTASSATNQTTSLAPRFQALRLEAELSINGLARLADVDYKTVQRAEEGKPIQYFKALALVEALSQKLGRPISLDNTDLKLVDWR